MVSEQKEIDISEIRESLGTIIASFTYIYDPYAIIKEIDIIMSFEAAMLDVQGLWTEKQWGEEGIFVMLPPPRTDPFKAFTSGSYPDTNNPAIKNRMQEEKNRKRNIKNYKQLFDVFRLWWERAVESWNSQTGNWKDSIIICSNLRSHLMRIALKEQLVALSSSMYTIQLNTKPSAPKDEMFDDNGPKNNG